MKMSKSPSPRAEIKLVRQQFGKTVQYSNALAPIISIHLFMPWGMDAIRPLYTLVEGLGPSAVSL